MPQSVRGVSLEFRVRCSSGTSKMLSAYQLLKKSLLMKSCALSAPGEIVPPKSTSMKANGRWLAPGSLIIGNYFRKVSQTPISNQPQVAYKLKYNYVR